MKGNWLKVLGVVMLLGALGIIFFLFQGSGLNMEGVPVIVVYAVLSLFWAATGLVLYKAFIAPSSGK